MWSTLGFVSVVIIAEAIFNSVDVRMDVLPMSPMAVLDSIKQNFKY